MGYFVSRDEMDEAIKQAVDGVFKAIAKYLVEEMKWESGIKNLEEDVRIRIREELVKKDREKN